MWSNFEKVSLVPKEAKDLTVSSFSFGKNSSPHDPIDVSSSSSSSSSSDGDTDNEISLSTEDASNQLALYDPVAIGSQAIELVPNPLQYEAPSQPINKPQNSIPRELPSVGAFTVQCAYCLKWRLIPTQEKYEEIREYILERPFSCETAREWRPDVSCDDPEDISQDGSTLWAIDKPSIARPPAGWQRLLRMRGEGSTKFADIYYVAPSGKRLRSVLEIQKYMLHHPEYARDGLTLSQFSFQIPKPLQDNYVRKRPRITAPHGSNGPAQANPPSVSCVLPADDCTELPNGRTVLPTTTMDSSTVDPFSHPANKTRNSESLSMSNSNARNIGSSNESQSNKATTKDQRNLNAPIVKKVRGSTRLRSLVARHQEQRERVHVEFDSNMHPVGAEEDRFISYVGYLARSKVGILYPKWKSVPRETHDIIWQQILQTYDVPDTKAMKKHWMGEVRLRWKDFKNKLTRHYIRGARKDEDPCEKYPFLSTEDWRLFVASRQDPKFQELSQANKEKQAENKYPHCMSRGGYYKLEQKMIAEELERRKEASKSNPNVVIEAPPPPPRHKKWKAGRMRGGKYINEDVAEVAEKIDDLTEQSSQGSFSQSGRMDILSTAIGKLDYPGQVRGEPRGVGLTKYFGRASPYSSERELVSKVQEEVRQSLREEVCQSVREEFRQELEMQLRKSLRDELMNELRGQMRSEMRSLLKSERLLDELRAQDSPAFPVTKQGYNSLEVPVGDPSPTPEAREPCIL